jgi:hypothetical protein
MAALYSRIVAVRTDGVETLFERKRKKRRVSKQLRPLEKMARRNLVAGNVYNEELLRRHNRSNRKRRNGWLRDMGTNVMRAQSKATRKLMK